MTQISARSLENLVLSPEKRAENTRKMKETHRKMKEARYRALWEEARRMGVQESSSRVMAKALDISPSTARAVKKLMSE